MRQYESIWIKIKTTGSATLKVAPVFAETVRHAVRKEKGLDLAFKVTQDDDYYYLRYSYNSKTQIMTFTLKRRIGEL